MKTLRIWLLKRKLRRAYREYLEVDSSMACGAALADHITGRVTEARVRCNRILGELAKLDPENCPCTRII